MRLFHRIVLYLGLMGATIAPATTLDAPTGNVLLTVSGLITRTNAAGRAEFDEDMLRQLDWEQIQTYTSFTQGEQSFSGPTLPSVLEAVGATGGTVHATAINDYTVDFPVAYAKEHHILLAREHNGTPMRIRDKGPLWVIFPLDEETAASQKFDAEMIWQLTAIDIQP